MTGVGVPSGIIDTAPLQTAACSRFMKEMSRPASLVPRASNPFSGALKSKSSPCAAPPSAARNSMRH